MVEVQNDHDETLITLTTDIVVSYVSNNSVAAEEVSALIKNVHQTLSGLGLDGGGPKHGPSRPCRSARRSSAITSSASKMARR